MYTDCHVHLVGDGSSGSGCWLAPGGFIRRAQQKLLLKSVGLSGTLLAHGGIDQAYSDFVVAAAEQSSLSYVVLLAQDYAYSEQGEKLPAQSTFYVPNEHLFRVAERSKKIVPACSIHPARKDALDELERCAARGARLVKLLPNCHLVDCSRTQYSEFWQKMAEFKMFFLCHTGGELVLKVNDKRLQDPRLLQGPLECGVSVIAAHGATNSHPLDRNYLSFLAEMMQRYPHLYCDNSALISPFRGRHLTSLQQGIFAERVIHGSDIPVPVIPFWALFWRQISFDSWTATRAIENPLERDFQIKKAAGFSEASFTRLAQLLELPKRTPV